MFRAPSMIPPREIPDALPEMRLQGQAVNKRVCRASLCHRCKGQPAYLSASQGEALQEERPRPFLRFRVLGEIKSMITTTIIKGFTQQDRMPHLHLELLPLLVRSFFPHLNPPLGCHCDHGKGRLAGTSVTGQVSETLKHHGMSSRSLCCLDSREAEGRGQGVSL